MINKVLGMGYVSSKPEYQGYSSGKCKASLSMGINYGKDTTWVEVECWDKIAKNANTYLNKGSLVFIEAKLKYTSWKDKNGSFRSKLFCVCDFLKVINTKNPEASEKEIHNISKIKKTVDSDIEQQKQFDDVPW